jgi:hypothetical protein
MFHDFEMFCCDLTIVKTISSFHGKESRKTPDPDDKFTPDIVCPEKDGIWHGKNVKLLFSARSRPISLLGDSPESLRKRNHCCLSNAVNGSNEQNHAKNV